MIYSNGNVFQLNTLHTTYCFQVLETGHLEHLYYGAVLPELTESEVRALTEKRLYQGGNMIAYDQEHLEVTLEDLRLEVSTHGKGDIREPFAEVTFADGSRTTDFLFESASQGSGSLTLDTLPTAHGDAEYLTVTLVDDRSGLLLDLHYIVYADCDVICRNAVLRNEGDASVRVGRLMSAQLDYSDSSYVMTTFHGAWAREMESSDFPLVQGVHVNRSACGISSNRANPLTLLSRPGTTETSGECYGFNLIYSGNHYEAAEVGAYGKARFVTGIDPQGFDYLLEPGEKLEAPQAVMTYASSGYAEMSRNMHAFIRGHITPKAWQGRVRPVLLNSWEATYFDIDERKTKALAKAAADVGIELFVMDDGWFKGRNDETSSLGDWIVDEKKLPHGLEGIAEEVNKLGMRFGIWVEPEMISENSDLYRAHPDWAMQIPGRSQSQGRNQLILDLANPAVVAYLVEAMRGVLDSSAISYVKWDMNRIFSDVYSPYLPAERQGETAHRYILGLYQLLETLMTEYPNVLFEGCASGGNRFDLGALCYFPQIWASDNTDPVSRARIQRGYSYGYPQDTYTAHVSASPNHQTLRKTPLNTRYNVAATGVLGYELNLVDLSREDREAVKAQIEEYKKWREVLQFGQLYRGGASNAFHAGGAQAPGGSGFGAGYGSGAGFGVSAGGEGLQSMTIVSPDGSRAVGIVLQDLVQPNTQYMSYRAVGLDADATYRFYNIPQDVNIKEFGDLINLVSPIHIRPDSLAHRTLARIRKMQGEAEDYTLRGSVLMGAGVQLAQGFSGTGFGDDVRIFQDFASRMYYMERME